MVKAVALPVPVTTTPAAVINPQTVVVTEKGAMTTEIKDVKGHRRARLDTHMTLMTRDSPVGVGAAILHPEDPMPRFGNGRGRLININSEN